MPSKTIPIFFTLDESYAPYLDCAIRSLTSGASRDYTYDLYILHQDLTPQSREKLCAGIEEPFRLHFIPMEQKLPDITDRAENRLRCDYFTLTIYFRLFIADLFPGLDKCIYLDSDIIVPGDISRLYQVELGENLLAACPDHSIVAVPELVEYVRDAVGVDIQHYINSGVLVMNLKKMRQVGLAGHFLHLLNTYHFDCLAPDQDYFNAMCSGSVRFLDETWDAMPPQGGQGRELAQPQLIHFNLFQKPWCYDDIPYEDYFWYWAQRSPFYPQIRAGKDGYSRQQQESDRSCMLNMIRKGALVGQQDVTFRKMSQQGVKIRLC